jgi:hypothetical protein
MTKIYLSEDAVVRTRLDGEHDHLGMAKTVLGAAWTPGDTAEAIEANYRAMWDAGWVRVIDTPTTLYGEKWLGGETVPFANLPRVQREWLAEHSALVGKQLYWNAKVFESTREGQSNAAQAAQVLMAGQTFSDMQKLYLSKDGVVRAPTGGECDHLDIARTILGAAAQAPGVGMLETYHLMWDAGWVRVVSTPHKLYGEKLMGRQKASIESLPHVQREWLEDNSKVVGKQLIWNDSLFESTREGHSNAARSAQVLSAGQPLGDMQRIYLSEDGVARTLTSDETDHIAMARTILGAAAKDAKTDFDLYCLMWGAGWVRVVSTPEKLYGEKLLPYGERPGSLRQVPIESLPHAQHEWLKNNSVLVGKQLVWNDAVFESTREGGSNASRAAQVLMADGRESTNREPARPITPPA